MRESYTAEGKSPPKIGPYQLTRNILKSEGVSGLFRGLTATFTREMPGYFFFFFAYEYTRELLRDPGQSKDDIGVVKTVISGGMAGVTLWTLIFPADVVKSRLQVTDLLVNRMDITSLPCMDGNSTTKWNDEYDNIWDTTR